MKGAAEITVVGPDSGGIVAEFTRFVFEYGANIERIDQNVLNGLFGMHLRVSFGGALDRESFNVKIRALAKRQKMDVNVHYDAGESEKLAVLVTKESHCLEALLAARRTLRGKIAVIIGTQRTLAPLAKKASIPFVTVAEKSQEKAEARILSICKRYDAGLIVLARYMRILNPNFVWRYPNRIINIHPSLLPAFPGAMAYAQAFERGTKIAGVTAHYVTENLDQGPIILQDSFGVEPADTLGQIKERGRHLEAKVLLRAVRLHLEGRADVRWRKVHTG